MSRRTAWIISVGIFFLQACVLPVRIIGLESTTESTPGSSLKSNTPESMPTPMVSILAPENTGTADRSSNSRSNPTQTPSQTPEPSQIVSTIIVTQTIVPSSIDELETIEPEYFVQPGSPIRLMNFAHPEAGCNWIGVAGQVFDTQYVPVTSLVILVEGKINGADVRFISLTGVAPVYGPGGYEIILSNQPFASRKMLSIQIFDLAGNPLSEAITFDTYADCNENLIIMNFVDELPAPGNLRYYFPLFFSSYLVE